MNARFWNVAAALCLVASAIGCKSEEGHAPTPPGPSLTMTASATTVVANGTNTVTFTVTDTGGVAVTVTTDRGSFSTGGQSYAIAAGSGVTTGTVTLVTCSSSNAGCTGAATVTATSTTGQATRSVNFTSLAAACATSCATDSGCAGQACTSGGAAGTCTTSSPSVCSTGTTPANPTAGFGGLSVPQEFATTPVMGVKSSGWNELNRVAVQALDDQGQPYAAGLTVRFEHRQLGGSTFGAPLAAPIGACTAANHCVAYDATTDADGVATAPLYSGTVAGTLVVTATATVGTDTRSVTLPGIAVVGAKASGANFGIQCSPRNVPALAETDCSTSWVDAQITCAALLKDRFNNLLATQTEVIFASEAAAVAQVAWTPQYSPDSEGSTQLQLGTATQIFQTLSAGLPFDVEPLNDGATPPVYFEPFASHDYDGCGLRTHNPRDGVVTIIAMADGEEAFFDANGNGAYDAETFTDANANGLYDAGEAFVDANANGRYDAEPFVAQGEPFIDQDDDGKYTPADPATSFDGEWFADLDGNGKYTPANGKWDAQKKIWTQTVVVYTGGAANLDLGDGNFLGHRWVDDDATTSLFQGACEPSPPASEFAVLAKDPLDSTNTPTSMHYVVVASDMNLNQLATATSYKVEPGPLAKVKVTYDGLPSYADELGFFYRYWPCDRTGACASQCRATGAAAPCTMTPSIDGFECGVAAGVTITGGDQAGGVNDVKWSVDTPWNVYLGGKIGLGRETLSGTNE